LPLTSAFASTRVVRPEDLDSLPPDDPRARRSRVDLQRVHRAMRSVSILAHAIARLDIRVPPRRILELGAGDGTLLFRLLRSLGTRWPGGELILLDQHDLVSTATRARFVALGWNVQVTRADALDWARSAHREHYDLCLTTLFLHHFESFRLMELLKGVAVSADAFIACEPRRNVFSKSCGHLLFLLGVNGVTRRDGITSIDAGFANREISALWPAGTDAWQIEEYFAAPFTHCFAARRLIRPGSRPESR